MSLKQHQQGKHSNGFITHCGYVCQWPDEKHAHQKECRECAIEKEKKLDKDQNPQKPKKRNKIFKNRGVSKKPNKETENESDVQTDSKNSDTENKSDNQDIETPKKETISDNQDSEIPNKETESETDSKDIDNQDSINKDNETPPSHQEGSDE